MDRFDHLYMTIAKEAGGLEALLNSFFSFLYRRTDFFYEADPTDKMGFPPGVNQQILFTIFKQYQDEYYKKMPKKSPEEYKAKLEALRAQQKETKPEIVNQDSVTPAPIQKTPEQSKPKETTNQDAIKANTETKTKDTKEIVKNEVKPKETGKDNKYKDIR